MRTPIHRRRFLQVAGAAGAGLALPGKGAGEAGLPADAGAPNTSREPRLFVGCCAYSYAKYLEKGPMTMEDFILKGVELGLHGVDITTYYLKSTEPSYLTGLRHLAFKNGVPFSGAAIGTDMCQPDPVKRKQELEKIRKWVDATEWLGASHLRVFGGEIPKGATVEQGVQWVVETLKPACEYSAQKGITLGIESHGGITSRAEQIVEILRRVDSPYAGINLDISNFSARSVEDQYAQIEACVPYATHTHIRDFFSETHEPIDLDRAWQLFAKGGYKGYMSAEYEGEEDPTTGVPKLIEKIKALCKKYSTA
jgi:sugar phosphate isomerase/epimerase